MESFTVEFVSNASAQLFPDNTLSSFTIFLPEQLNLEGQWEVATSEISYPSMYQNVTQGKFMFFDKKLSESSEIFYLEPGLYPYFTDIVEALKTFVRESHKHREICICTIISRQDTHLFHSILPERMNLEGQWQVAVSKASYTSMYQNVTEGK